MLKADTITKIKALGFDPDKLIAAIKADTEVDYEVPAGTMLTDADLTTRDTVKLTEGRKAGELDGEKKGKELAAKAFKKKFNLADTVPNDPDKVAEAVNTELGKGDVGLKEQISLLQKDKEKLTSDLTVEQQKARAAAFDSELISHFPANRTADLTDAERLALVKMNLTFEDAEGKPVVKRNGEILRDAKSQAPIAPKDAVATLFADKKWIAAEGGAGGGRGGGNNPGAGGSGAGIKTLSKFTEKWKAENPGKNDISPEFDTALQTHTKGMTDFNMFE